MARDFARQFYKSAAWQHCRDSFIAYRRSIDGGICQRCHDAPGYIVHHRIYLTPRNILDPNVALNFDNLEYVCHDCHNLEHQGGKPLLCRFDEQGRPINAGTADCRQN